MPALRNMSSGAIVATRVDRLTGFFPRALGLLARRSLSADEGVWLTSCRAIHTIGMAYAIDVVFIDGSGRVLRTCRNVPPNKFALRCVRAAAVIELRGGALDRVAVNCGDQLELVASMAASRACASSNRSPNSVTREASAGSTASEKSSDPV